MGYLELFAQQTFAEETERVTGGAAGWQDPPEIRLEKVQSDGFLVIRRPHLLDHLTAPWPLARPHDEIMLELKLAGNHFDRRAIERALLRRQARQVQRLEEQDPSWLGEEQLWLVAPHLPGWLAVIKRPLCCAPGCYWVEPDRFLWIAANELPLCDELVPFLMARSGQPLDELARWVAPRRPLEWTLIMLEYLPMSLPTREELLQKFRKVDPEIQARRRQIIEALLEGDPEAQRQLREQGRLEEARASLRRVLARRQLAPSTSDNARIDACSDLATLERWLDRAVTAVSVVEALE